MKKYFGVLAGLVLALSMSFASAQITGGGVQVVCVRYNQDGSCAQTAISGNVVTGSGSSGSVNTGGGTGGGAVNTSGGPAYQQGQYQRGAGTADLSFVANLIAQVGGIVRLLPPILTGIAVIAFFVYLIRYFLISKDNADNKKKDLSGMMYSLLAIFVMVALWGIIAFFGDAIGINPNTTVRSVQLPQ
jgi:hypothetical protein